MFVKASNPCIYRSQSKTQTLYTAQEINLRVCLTPKCRNCCVKVTAKKRKITLFTKEKNTAFV